MISWRVLPAAVAATAAVLMALVLAGEPAQAAAKSTALTLTTQATSVAKGAPIVLGGVLRAGTKKLGGQKVTFFFQKAGTRAYTAVTSAKTDAVGRFTLQRTAVTSGTWKVDYRGTSAYRSAAATRTVTVTVVGDKLLTSFVNIVVRVDASDGIPGEIGEWGSRRFNQEITRNYKVAWSFSCTAATVTWRLYWIEGSSAQDDVEVALTDYVASGSGVFTGHDGWDGDPTTDFYKYLKLDIHGENSRSCKSTIRIYVTGRVAV